MRPPPVIADLIDAPRPPAVCFTTDRRKLLLLQPAVERHVAEWLWNPVIQTVLEQPTWLVLGMIGAILIVLGRKRKPLIGYGRD